MYDIIIIGAGPAGLTSALYALRAHKKVLVLESNNYGGQILRANLVENYPAIKEINGYDFSTTLYNQVIELGCEYKLEEVKSINKNKEVVTNNETYKAKAIIIATGVCINNLGLENEKQLVGKGVSYCATCDGNFYKGKEVAVVGGGNTAVEDALYLSGIAKKVYLIHRRNSFRAEEILVKKVLKKKNIEIIYNSTVKSINGKEKLESIDIINNKEEKRKLDISGLFIAIGHGANTGVFKNIINLNENGYIKSDDLKTNIKNIYVAGDVREKDLRQLVTATSDGALAATLAIKEMDND